MKKSLKASRDYRNLKDCSENFMKAVMEIIKVEKLFESAGLQNSVICYSVSLPT